jgi:hypothetical protein
MSYQLSAFSRGLWLLKTHGSKLIAKIIGRKEKAFFSEK